MDKNSQEQKKKSMDDSWARSLAVAGSAAFTLLSSIAGFLWIGHWLDGQLGLYPVLTVWGGIIGGFGGVYLMYKEISR